MWTTALFARSTLIWRARSRRSSGTGRPWPLENWLPSNHALRTLSRTALALHRPCSRSALHGASRRSAWRSCTRRRRGVNRTRPGLRRNHSSLLHNRLARHGLRRRRSRSSLRTGSCNRWRCRSFWCWRRNNCCGRSDHNCGRGRRLFNWRRRNHYRRRRLHHGRCDHNTSFRCRSSRFRRYNSRFLSCLRLCSRSGCFHGSRGCSGRCGNGRPGRRCGRMLFLLLSLSEQPCYVARLGDLGEVYLRLDLSRGRSLPRR